MDYRIIPYEDRFGEEVAELVLYIQTVEFSLPVTLEQEPDLTRLREVYRQGRGDFWVAVAGEEVIGTIGVQDIGERQGALRRMFVKERWRGPKFHVAQNLLETLESECRGRGFRELFLGTIEATQAAQRFYLRNGYTRIEPEALPAKFPRFALDTKFFRKTL
ncbi:MAG TPA: GNAT family N-acetyltransferase [Terriglobales bacterium]|nr:GNAT family N-acetyltransferase [Terriglobales bacterium]